MVDTQGDWFCPMTNEASQCSPFSAQPQAAWLPRVSSAYQRALPFAASPSLFKSMVIIAQFPLI